MKRIRAILLVVLSASVSGWPSGVAADTEQHQAVEEVVVAANNHQPAPVISKKWQLTAAEAYRIQAALFISLTAFAKYRPLPTV